MRQGPIHDDVHGVVQVSLFGKGAHWLALYPVQTELDGITHVIYLFRFGSWLALYFIQQTELDSITHKVVLLLWHALRGAPEMRVGRGRR